MTPPSLKIVVVIPCYKVRANILKVLCEIPPLVSEIYVIDDACPENTGQFVKQNCHDRRVSIEFHSKNRGVGGALKTGYRKASAMKADIIIKLDGDGQMDAKKIPELLEPIVHGKAHYVKGTRFRRSELSHGMPLIRYIGNKLFSAMSRLATGYSIDDVLNGYTAIAADTLRQIDLSMIADDYFFESDMVFQLAIAGAVVAEIETAAIYENQASSLSIPMTLLTFPPRYLRQIISRLMVTVCGDKKYC